MAEVIPSSKSQTPRRRQANQRRANQLKARRHLTTRRELPPRPPKTGIGMLLREADAAFNRYLTGKLAAHGVTFSQFQHLRNLWVEDGLTQAELSRRIGIEMASSTAVLDALESEGLVTRLRNAGDRRKVNVFLTAEGAALEPALMACAREANTRASKGLGKAEVAQLFAIAGQVIENFKALRAGQPQAPRGRARRNVLDAAE
jgi:MarR family transcriptional regulator, organic hydroperoxide resistance regulator